MFSQHFAWPKFYCSSRLKKKTKHVFCPAGVRAPPAAHSVRALHSLRLPILRQCLLYDGGTLCLQHRLPAHERKGEVRLKTNVLYKFISSVTFSCSVKRWSLRFCIIMQGQKKRKRIHSLFWLLSGGQRSHDRNAVIGCFVWCILFVLFIFFNFYSEITHGL